VNAKIFLKLGILNNIK